MSCEGSWEWFLKIADLILSDQIKEMSKSLFPEVSILLVEKFHFNIAIVFSTGADCSSVWDSEISFDIPYF